MGRLHTCEFLIKALKRERQPFVIDADLVQNGGVEIAHVNRVLGDVVTEVIGLAVAEAAFDTAAGHPGGEAARVVVAPEVLWAAGGLAIGGSTELAGEDNQCIVQEAALLQIPQ